MKTASPMPTRLMRGMANATFKDMALIYRNDGYGWDLVGQTRCSVHHLLRPPQSGDPMDSSAAQTSTVQINIPRKIPAYLGDHIHTRDHVWTVGEGNFDESYASHLHLVCARPTASTPKMWITIRRINPTTRVWEALSPQLVQLAWSRNQPDRLGGVAIRQYGWIFAPDDTESLDVKQGDSFFHAGLDHVVQWVPPEPNARTEAIFWTNIGEGT